MSSSKELLGSKQAREAVKKFRLTDIGCHVPPEHHRIFLQALSRVTSSELADDTFSQIVDGLPTWDTAYHERRSIRKTTINHAGHPLRKHVRICDGAMEKMKIIKSQFDTEAIPFDGRVSPSTHGPQQLALYRITAKQI